MALADHESDLDILMYSAKCCACLFLFSRQSTFFCSFDIEVTEECISYWVDLL